MSDPSAAMFHRTARGNVEGSELINSGRDTTSNVQNNYNFNIGVFSDVLDLLRKVAPRFVAEVPISDQSQSTAGGASSMDDSDPLSQTTDNAPRPSIPEGYLADISDIVPSDPDSLRVASIADKYTRFMLRCLAGYPLYEPHPFSELSKEYLRNGVNVGDVGFVRGDGNFDFLFNICPSKNLSINPPLLPARFYLESLEHSKTMPTRGFPSKTFLQGPITLTNSGEYICQGQEGAILELPKGAIEEGAIGMLPFRRLAARHGVEWYEYAMNRGRDIPNGSLYLITSFTKCTRWGIAVFDRSCDPGQGLVFVSNPFGWKGSRVFTTKVANTDHEDPPNQCVFLRGYKITIRQDIFEDLQNDQLRGSSRISLTQQPAHRIRGGGRSDLISKILDVGSALTRTTKPAVTKSDNVILHPNFNTSLVHPSEFINIALLNQNPGAKVALTHDDVWCDLLQDNFPEHNYMTMINVARTYTSSVDEYGCVYLEKIPDSDNINAIRGNATSIRFGDGQFTEIQRNLICDYMANPTILPDIDDNLKKHVLTQSIKTLPLAEAVFNDYQTKQKCGPCFEGTRVALLREMAEWVTGPGESRMYVLSGLAGIGKSTVAYTIASRATDLNLLGASFFFSRDEADRKDAKRFFTTIAYQLCVYDETFAKAIGDVLLTERGSVAATKNPQKQLQALIVDPLRDIVQSRVRPILIVIDALDECDEDDEPAVVAGLSELVRLLPSFRVVLTTCPQPLANYLFGNHDGHKTFYLQDIEDKVVNGDIRLYLSYSLSQKQVKASLFNPQEQWSATDEDLQFLVQAAGRLFIIASALVRYILDKFTSNPAAQMKKLLWASAQDRMDLNEFYNTILRNVVPVNCDEDAVNRYQSVIGGILFVQQPLPVAILARLIDREEEEIREVLVGLQSAILLGDDDIPRIYHESFPDYITDLTRCKDIKLSINPGIHHTQIVTCCFKIMEKHLKYNILGLGDPAQFMNNEDGLKEDGITDEQLRERIPRQLGYACVYWSNHLKMANMKNADLRLRLENFAHEHILHWFEVLSLIGKLGTAHIAIRAVMRLLSTSPDLHQLLSNALRFISKFYGLIEKSALHTYHSALPFTPTGSLLYRRYIKKTICNLWDVDGGPKHWDALVASLNHGEWVNNIKFSLDSTIFVSFSEKSQNYTQGKLKIWDAVTGTPISTIPGQRFAVANDFSTIASSEDNIITFYNVSGSTRSAMITTSSKIEKLALSSESSRVAAALSNGTICLWASANAELINSFDGFNTDAQILEFSPTGARLVYRSTNVVKLRDGISGRFIANLKCGSRLFVFSADGSRIASLSRFDHLKLWNSDSGQLIGDISHVDDNKLAISANGSLVATADAWSMKLWSENGGQLRRVKVLDERLPRSIAFSASRNNILAIAYENTVKLYDVKTYSFVSTLPFSWGPTASAFSPDCAYLAAGSKDGSIFLWDIQRIESSSPSHNRVTAFAFSRDCSRLACGFKDGSVGLWEAIPTIRRIKTWMQQTRGFDPSREGYTKALAFSLDGRLFASGSYGGNDIKLWNGRNGALRGTFKAPSHVRAVAVSTSLLAAGWDDGVTLWTLDTLRLIHTFQLYNILAVSIAENSALAAAYSSFFDCINLLDVVNRTTIATFNIPDQIHTMTFLPDSSHLVAQSKDGAFQSLGLNNKVIVQGPMLEHLIQLPNIPLRHGVPIWYDRRQHCLVALFSQHTTPVPVLRIPRDLQVENWTLGSSMIVLFCQDGRLIFLRLLSTVHAGWNNMPSFISMLNTTK